MLSSNDYRPECRCDDDFFDLSLTRIKNLISNNDEAKALRHIENILVDELIDLGEAQIHTNYPFQTMEEFGEWLLEWKNKT